MVIPIRIAAIMLLLAGTTAMAQVSGKQVYTELRDFHLSGSSAVAENLVLKRDRVEMTFNGRFYFEVPVAGRVLGAVFTGTGSLRAQPPPEEFERENLRRLLKADVVERDFRTAVLRFTDDTFALIGRHASSSGPAPQDVQRIAAELNRRLLRETGANLAARVAISVINNESPGFFAADFDGGRRGRFSFILDHQSRIPVATFDINAGEKGLLFAHRGSLTGIDVWLAFFAEDDYARGNATYADAFDLVAVPHYQMEIGVTDPKNSLKVKARMDLAFLAGGVQAIPLAINANLPEHDSVRLKKALRLKSAATAAGSPVDAVQEDWEGGVTLYLAQAGARGETVTVVLEFEGDFMYDSDEIPDVFYAYGAQTQVAVKLPGRPESVELDPDQWVLSEKTSTTRAH